MYNSYYWYTLFATAVATVAGEVPETEKTPIKIREEQYQIQFEQDYMLNNQFIPNPQRKLQDFDPTVSSTSLKTIPQGRPALPTEPKSPIDHKHPISNFTKNDPAIPYYYPPRQRFPLPQCFHNPTGYVCCSVHLNELMVDTYAGLEANPKFHVCNVGAVASAVQNKAEQKFNTSFEVITGFEDFAQKIHFSGDLVCKIELGGKYIMAYATAENALFRIKNYRGRFQENAEKDMIPERRFEGPDDDSLAIHKLMRPEFNPYLQMQRNAELFEPQKRR